MRGSTLIVLYGVSDFKWNFLLTKQTNSKRNADALDLALDGKKKLNYNECNPQLNYDSLKRRNLKIENSDQTIKCVLSILVVCAVKGSL